MGRKRILIGVAFAIAGLLIVGELLSGFLRLESQRRRIERRLSEAAGLEVKVGGDFRLHLFPAPRFEAADVTVANLPGRPSPHLLAIDSVDLVFDSWRLLLGAIEIDSLTLVGVEAHVETDAQGGFRVAHDADALVDEEVSGPLDLRIRRFEAEDVGVFLLDGESGRLTTLNLSELTLAAEDFDGPITLEARGEIDGAGFDLAGSGGALRELLQPTAPYPVALAGRLLEAIIEVDGTVAAPFDLRGLDVQVRIHAQDLAAIGSILGLPTTLPPIGPIDGAASLRDRDGTLAIEDIAVTLGSRDETWAEVTGVVGDVARFRGIQLQASLRAADPDALAARFGREIPDIGPIRGSAYMADVDGTLGIESLELHGGRAGTLAIDLSGSFDDVREIDEVELEIALSASHLGVIGALFESNLPGIGPVEFTGRVRGSDEKIVFDGTLRLDETVLSGDWSGAFVPGSRPSVKARIESPHVHLDDVGIEPHPAASPVPLRDAATTEKPRWSEGPLQFEQLHAVDVDLELRADRVTGRSGLELTDVRTSFRLDDGELTIRERGAGYEAGSVEILFRVDSRTAVPSIAFLANTRGVNLTRLMSQFQEKTEHAGLLDLAVEVESHGRSFDEIRSQLAGRVEGRLRDGTLASKHARKLLLEVAHVSIPDFRPRPSSPVDCFAVALDIDEGVASVETLRLEAPKVVVTGTGEVDLAANDFDLRLTPEPRDPSLLSIAATVNVTGPIDDPAFKAMPRSLATSATRAIVRNALKPAGMLTRPLRKSKAESGPDDCPLDPFVPDFP